MRSRYLALAIGALLWVPIVGTCARAVAETPGRPMTAVAPQDAPSVTGAAQAETVAVVLTQTDIANLYLGVSNAGAACDQGIKVYCDILRGRDAAMSKLQAAFQQMTAPAAHKEGRPK